MLGPGERPQRAAVVRSRHQHHRYTPSGSGTLEQRLAGGEGTNLREQLFGGRAFTGAKCRGDADRGGLAWGSGGPTSMALMPSLWSRRWLRWGLAAVVVLLLAAGGAVAFVLLHTPGNVSHPNLSSSPPDDDRRERRRQPKRHRASSTTSQWPRYGFDAAPHAVTSRGPATSTRRCGSAGRSRIRAARVPAGDLPARRCICRRQRSAKAINKRTGQSSGSARSGRSPPRRPRSARSKSWSSSRCCRVRGPAPGNGRIVALSMKTGRVVWSHVIRAGTESSPLAWGSTCISATRAGTSTRCDAPTVTSTGSTTRAARSRAVRRWPTGSCTSATTRVVRTRSTPTTATRSGRSSTSGAHFGFGSGNFYSTPAVAFGRVYMGNTDGRVYSFAARYRPARVGDGPARTCTRRAAVADPPGLGPTVYLGSYDGNFYAFNAQSGAVRWTHTAGGRISGSATIVGNVVYSRTSAPGPPRPRPTHRPEGVLVPRRRVQPGDRRPRRDLHGRLLEDLPDAARRARAAPGRHAAAPAHARSGRRSRTSGKSSKNAPQKSRKTGSAEHTFGHSAILRSMRCRSGSHCQQPAVQGRRFCADHAAELDRMREELKDAAAARIGRGRPKRSSTCCRPGCYEPRVPPAAYCDTCSAAGYVEEAA